MISWSVCVPYRSGSRVPRAPRLGPNRNRTRTLSPRPFAGPRLFQDAAQRILVDGIDDDRAAHVLEQHEPHAAAVLLVHPHRGEDLICWWQRTERVEAERREQPRVPRGEAGRRDAELLGQSRGERHPDRDRLAVRASGERIEALQRMAERVAVVQDETPSRVAFVLADDGGLGPDAPRDQRFEHRRPAFQHCCGIALKHLQQLDVERQRVLGHLGEAGAVLAIPEGRERGDVGEHGDGLVERADEVLPLRQIDRGFAPHRRVDLRRERRRHLEEGNPPHVGRRDEARKVADGTAAERDDEVVAVCLLCRELTMEHRRHRKRLRVLALRYYQVHARPAALCQPSSERLQVALGHLGVGHDERALDAGELGQVRASLVEDPRRDRHVIRPARNGDGHALHRSNSFWIAAATSSTGPLASTTCAANSRYSGSRSLNNRSRSPSSRMSGRSDAGRTRSPRTWSGTERTTPPPHETTDGSRRATSTSAAASSSRNRASPSRSKMSRTDAPPARSTSASSSTNGTPNRAASTGPTVDLPEPGMPTR